MAGRISNHKGINLPGVAVSVPAMSEKDKDDLRWALGLTADMIALSFVRCGEDVEDVRAIMDEVGVHLPVIAKIEKPQAIDNIDEIVEGLRRRAWSPAATSASSARSRTCRSCRSRSSRPPGATPSRSSSPPRCSSR